MLLRGQIQKSPWSLCRTSGKGGRGQGQTILSGAVDGRSQASAWAPIAYLDREDVRAARAFHFDWRAASTHRSVRPGGDPPPLISLGVLAFIPELHQRLVQKAGIDVYDRHSLPLWGMARGLVLENGDRETPV